MSSPSRIPGVTADIRARMTSPSVGVEPALEPGGDGQAQVTVRPDGNFRVVLPDSGRGFSARGAGTIVTGRIAAGSVSFDPVPNQNLWLTDEHQVRGGVESLMRWAARRVSSVPYAETADPRASVTALLQAAENNATSPADVVHWRNWRALAEGRELEPVSRPAHRSFSFDTGKAGLNDGMRTYLRALASDMERDPSITVDISGHASRLAQRRSTNNEALAQQRADMVRDFLTSLGVDARRVNTRGAGTTEPASDPAGAIPPGRNNLAGDRRVDLMISGNGGLRVFLDPVASPN